MSAYTRKNLKDVDNAAAKHGMGDGFAARFARQDLECTATGLCLQSLGPGQSSPFAHRHEEAEEVYVILTGSGRMRLDDEVIEVGAYDAVRVEPRVARSFEAGPDGLELIVFGPHHDGDGEILPVTPAA
jgi:mannose-6-phosphate isomerase-like protein (cupin superfamily)